MSEQHKNKIGLANKGRIYSEEQKILKRLVHQTPDFRKKISKAQKGRKHKPNEGFQKGHKPIKGTEKTRFRKGLIPWNKGKGKGKDPIKIKINSYKSSAKIRGLIFNLNYDEFKKLITGDCVYCNEKSSGVDRIDNTKGYIMGNVVSCCGICNHMKWNLPVNTFIQKCKDIANKNVNVLGYEID